MDYLIHKIKLKEKKIDGFENSNSLLGKGASGKVYSYLSTNNEQLVVKMMGCEEWDSYNEFYKDIVWQSMVHEELNKLDSSVKVHGYDLYTDKGVDYVCFIMDFYEGFKDCFSFIDDNRNWSREVCTSYCRKNRYKETLYYTLDRKLKISAIKNMVSAVKDIHEVDIVHGDIKTNNIIINPETGDIKVIDFGAAIFIEDGRKFMETDWTHGTLGYRAPEEERDNLLGKSSDIYSLAVTIIELWTGNIWYSGESFKECRNEVLKALRIMEKEESDLGAILRKCLHMSGSRRPTIQKLNSFLQDYS